VWFTSLMSGRKTAIYCLPVLAIGSAGVWLIAVYDHWPAAVRAVLLIVLLVAEPGIGVWWRRLRAAERLAWSSTSAEYLSHGRVGDR
jgi:hypothetical protein